MDGKTRLSSLAARNIMKAMLSHLMVLQEISTMELFQVDADGNSGYFGRIMQLADKYRKLKVRTKC